MADVPRPSVARLGAASAYAIIAAVACAAPARSATVVVAIDGMKFAPASATVRRGDTVVWVNRDVVPHTVTAVGVVDSRAIAPGASWAYVATTPGRLEYACTLHPMMKAALVVE